MNIIRHPDHALYGVQYDTSLDYYAKPNPYNFPLESGIHHLVLRMNEKIERGARKITEVDAKSLAEDRKV